MGILNSKLHFYTILQENHPPKRKKIFVRIEVNIMKKTTRIRGINIDVLTIRDNLNKNNLLLKGFPVNRADRRKAGKLEKKECRPKNF